MAGAIAWHASRAREPSLEADPERQEAVFLASLVLAVVGIVGASVMLATGQFDGVQWAFYLVIFAMPLIALLAGALAHLGQPAVAGIGTIAGTATAVITVSQAAPSLVGVASVFLLLAAVLVLASQVMPFEYAAILGMSNIALSVAMPNFVPVAEQQALSIPYIFIFINAAILVPAGVLRSRDRGMIDSARLDADDAARRIADMNAEMARLEAMHADRPAEMEAQAKEQRAMLNAASHELRTPITPLRLQLAAYRLRYEESLDERQRNMIALLERNLRRMAHLVDELLDIGRMEHEGIELHVSDERIDQMLHDAVATFAPHAKSQGVFLHIDAAQLRARADADRITQVVYNLLSNALKFSPRGTSIHLGAQVEDGGITVRVVDEGIGLSPEQQQRLFQPFSQVQDAVHNNMGTGLGLYICKRIVEAHGGRIWAASEGPDTGAEFGFWIPAEAPRLLVPAR